MSNGTVVGKAGSVKSELRSCSERSDRMNWGGGGGDGSRCLCRAARGTRAKDKG